MEKGGVKHTFTVPLAIKDYNAHRGGVDNMDQRMAYYSLSKKTRKGLPRWYGGLSMSPLPPPIASTKSMLTLFARSSTSASNSCAN